MRLNSMLFSLFRIVPPSQAGVGFGSGVGSHGLFCPMPIPREIKLRQKKGPTSWGVSVASTVCHKFTKRHKTLGFGPFCSPFKKKCHLKPSLINETKTPMTFLSHRFPSRGSRGPEIKNRDGGGVEVCPVAEARK